MATVATLNTSWHSTVSALLADQAALAAVPNNTSNASTPGYSEETVSFSQASSVDSNGRPIGSGVSASSPQSQRDKILNEAVNQQIQAQAASSSRLSGYQGIESVFQAEIANSAGNASSGISGGMNALFAAFQQLASAFSGSGAGQEVLSAAQQLSDAFNAAANSLETQQTDLNAQISANITSINGLAKSIAQLNATISSVAPNTDAGTLEDQRQYDLTQLSKLVGIDQIEMNNNQVAVSTMGGVSLVSGLTAQALSVGDVGGVTHVFSGAEDITGLLGSGEGQISGYLQTRDADIPSALSAIDSLANAVGSLINNANEAGIDLNGNPGTAIFNLPSGVPGSAKLISVAIGNPSLIAAAAPGGGPGDTSNANALAQVGQLAILGAPNASAYLSSFIATIGSSTSNQQIENTAQTAALTQLQNQQSALSSVNLDTEATTLQNLEKAYQAASKVFSIISSLMASAINLGTETTVN